MTLYFYMIGAFVLGFLCKHPGTATIVYCVYHFLLWRPIIGTGFVSEIDFDVFYTLIFILCAINGWLLCFLLGMPSVFSWIAAQYFHYYKSPGDTTLATWKSARWAHVYAYRFGIGILMVCAFLAATLPFELIPMDLIWLGYLLSILCMVVVHVIFYFIWKSNVNRAREVNPIQNVSFKTFGAPYLVGVDYTFDVIIYIGIYCFVVTVVFCAVFAWANWFWQFWTALILWGVAFIFYLIMGLVVMKINKVRARMQTRREIQQQ